MSPESYKKIEGAAVQLYNKLESGSAGLFHDNPLFGRIVKGTSGSHYVVFGAIDYGPRLDQGLMAYSLEPSFPDAPTIITIPWAARIVLLGGKEERAITSRFRSKIDSIRKEWDLSPTTQKR